MRAARRAAIRRAAGAQLRQERKARREPTLVSISEARVIAVTVQMRAAAVPMPAPASAPARAPAAAGMTPRGAFLRSSESP